MRQHHRPFSLSSSRISREVATRWDHVHVYCCEVGRDPCEDGHEGGCAASIVERCDVCREEASTQYGCCEPQRCALSPLSIHKFLAHEREVPVTLLLVVAVFLYPFYATQDPTVSLYLAPFCLIRCTYTSHAHYSLPPLSRLSCLSVSAYLVPYATLHARPLVITRLISQCCSRCSLRSMVNSQLFSIAPTTERTYPPPPRVTSESCA